MYYVPTVKSQTKFISCWIGRTRNQQHISHYINRLQLNKIMFPGDSVVVAKENIIFHLVFCDRTNKNLFISRHTASTPNTRCTYLHWENAL